MKKTNFTAFYPSRRYWADSAIDFSDQTKQHWFLNQMKDEVFEGNTGQVTLKVCRDGRIMLRVEALEREFAPNEVEPIEQMVGRWGQYLDHMNAFYLLFDSAMLELKQYALFNLHEITHRDAFRVTFENGVWGGENMAMESIASTFQSDRFAAPGFNAMPNPAALPLEHDPRFSNRYVVDRSVFENAFSRFSVAIDNPGLVEKLALYAKSLSEYKAGNYETALVLSWFVIESTLNALWSKHLDSLNRDLPDRRKRINADRRATLATGRDYTSSVKSNMLELWAVLSPELFRDIDTVRGYRNGVVHDERFQSNAEKTQLALKTAQEMIYERWDFRFTLAFPTP